MPLYRTITVHCDFPGCSKTEVTEYGEISTSDDPLVDEDKIVALGWGIVPDRWDTFLCPDHTKPEYVKVPEYDFDEIMARKLRWEENNG